VRRVVSGAGRVFVRGLPVLFVCYVVYISVVCIDYRKGIIYLIVCIPFPRFWLLLVTMLQHRIL
jgi:hypothetical protein